MHRTIGFWLGLLFVSLLVGSEARAVNFNILPPAAPVFGNTAVQYQDTQAVTFLGDTYTWTADASAGPGILRNAFDLEVNAGSPLATVSLVTSITLANLQFSGPAAASIPVQLNLLLDGMLGISAAGDAVRFARVELQVAMTDSFSTPIGIYNDVFDVGSSGGSTSADPGRFLANNATSLNASNTSYGISTLFQPVFNVPVNEIVRMNWILTTSVQARLPGDTAFVDFGNTVRLPATGPVFVLPAGYTADSADLGVEDNAWVAAPVPEPAPAVLLAGLGGLRWRAARRRDESRDRRGTGRQVAPVGPRTPGP